MTGRLPFDGEAYAERIRSVDCFICAFIQGDARFRHHLVFDDGEHIVFLNRCPTTRGQLLVAPKRHVEHLAHDVDRPGRLRLQDVVHRAAGALESCVDVERLYVASLGSQQGNRHLHVYVAAIPPGTPPERQQLGALDTDRGVLRIPETDTVRLAAAIAEAMQVLE